MQNDLNDLNNEKREETKKVEVETLMGDMAKALQKGEAGLIKKIIQEEEKKEKIKKARSPQSLQNKFFFIVGLMLVLISAGSLYLTTFLKEEIIITQAEPQYNPVVFTDKNFFIEINEIENIPEKVYERVNATDVKKGGVEAILLTENKKVIGFKEFLLKIKSNFPSEGMSSLKDDFLLGAYKKDETTKENFFLIKVKSFADIFPYMRAWEAKIFTDLHSFFGIALTPENSYLQTKEFEDGITANKNTRILYDNDGLVVLEYVFADNNSIIITNKPSSIHEAMKRLASSKIRK